MRLTSPRNLLWIAALLAGICVTAPAQPAASRALSPPIQQLSTVNSGTTSAHTVTDSSRQGSDPGTQPENGGPGRTIDRVETAGVVPDSTSLLPVAALVGFSFLLGGIVCGTIKKRP